MATLLGILLAGGGTSPAWALVVTNASCSQQAGNTLRYDCTITTDVPADAWVRFGLGSPTDGVCTTVRATPTAQGGTLHAVTIYGLKPGEDYDWDAQARPAGGGPLVSYGTCGSLAVDASLPTGAGSSGLASLDISTAAPGGTRQASSFLTHYGCFKTGDATETDQASEALIIVDADGDIVWYQQPGDDLAIDGSGREGSRVVLEAVSLSRPLKRVLGIINHEIIVKYDLAGNLVTLLCRDDGSGYCPGTTTVPDATFDDYVHHDVQRLSTHIVALTAEDVDVDDVLNCDGNATTTQFPIIVDGLVSFDTTSGTPLLDLEWDFTDVTGVTVDYTQASCPPSGGTSYWEDMLEGEDYYHTNSFWFDAANQWMFSIHDLDAIYSIDSDITSGTYNQLIWTLAGDGTGDFSFVGGGLDEDFSTQHAAYWDPDGNLTLFDNDWSGGPDSRGLVLEMDETAMTVEAIEQYTVEDIAATNADCPMGGSTLIMVGGNAFTACPQFSAAPKRAVVNEFDTTDSAVWTVELECTTDYEPISNAFRAYPNPWL